MFNKFVRSLRVLGHKYSGPGHNIPQLGAKTKLGTGNENYD
jgi:hypothetical protein